MTADTNRRIFKGMWGAEAAAMLALSLPLMFTNVAQALLHTTDIALLGRLGPDTLAASALGLNLFNACLVFGSGMLAGSSAIMARELGRRKHSVREVRRTVRQAMWTAICMALPCWLLLWQAQPLLLLLGQSPPIVAKAAVFIHALQWGLLPCFFYMVLRSFVAALQRPIWSLLIGVAAVLANAIVTSTLIFGWLGLPALGLRGAGIGSAITDTLMFLGMALVVTRHRHFRRYRLFGRFWQPDWRRFRELWALGLPIGVTQAMEMTVFSSAVLLMGLFGTAALAAHTIAIQIATLTFMVPLGLSQAATVRVGLALGGRDPAAITRAGWTALAMGVGFMTLMALLMWFAPHLLLHAFIDLGDPANRPVIALATSFLAVAALFQIFDGAQTVGAGMLRGLQDTRMPMLYAGFGYWIVGLGSGALLAFQLGMGGIGIWVGLAIGLAIVSTLMVTRWMRRGRLRLVPQRG